MAAAIAQHQGGRWDLAEDIYRRVLAVEPNHPEALQLLGTLMHQRGQSAAAIEWIERAVALDPANPIAHHNLGEAYRALGQWKAAEQCFRRAIQYAPDFASAHNGLGLVLGAQGRFAEAAESYHRAATLNPRFADAHTNLGNVLRQLGRLQEAVAAHRRALECRPDFALAHCNLAVALQDLGLLDQAIPEYRRALELMPDLVEAHSNLAVAYQQLGKLDEAAAAHRRAIELRPDFAMGYMNLAGVLKDQGRLDESLACDRRALELRPDYAECHSNLLYTLHYCPDWTPQAICAEHRRWNERHAAPLARFIAPHTNDRSPERRLRVGYVSPDFRSHPQCFFTYPLFSAHDHQQYEIYLYADVARPDEITARLRSCCDVWRDVTGRSDAEIAQLVRRDQIDILVDLSMHMAHHHLLAFARKPAPVQVTWLAYQGTTGLSAIDYRLTDPYIDPLGTRDDDYVEQSVRLADSFWCYDPLSEEPAVGALPAAANGYVTFGCLNNFCKINPPMLRRWAEILRTLDDSRLVLLAKEGSHRQRTLDLLAKEGVAPDRVSFVGLRPRAQYLELYQGLDVALDTLPYNGQTTTLDALWMGVPVVTLVGTTACGRATLSLLANLGLPELAAHTPQEFVRTVVELARDLPRLTQLRDGLREQLRHSVLMDAPHFARSVEAAYRQMWRRWCAGETDDR
jgi:predicted O-linked N-acetylglucosamine transferase (SPINDLY family)